MCQALNCHKVMINRANVSVSAPGLRVVTSVHKDCDAGWSPPDGAASQLHGDTENGAPLLISERILNKHCIWGGGWGGETSLNFANASQRP